MSNVLDLRKSTKSTNAKAEATKQPAVKATTKPAPELAVRPASAHSAPPAPTQSGWLKWAGLLVLSLALAIIVIDTTLLNVSLRSIIIDLHTDIQGLQWVITAYALTLGALTITGGRLGDLFGRKRMFVTGAVLFAIGSLVASLSANLTQLIIGEALIEGIGAALMMPATSSLLIANFHGRDRAVAFGVWGSVAGASSAIGPILGGYLTSHYSWRWGFRINVVVAAVLVLGSLIIHESRYNQERSQLDVVGVILSATGLLAVVFGIIQSSAYGWWHAKQAYTALGYTLGGPLSVTPISIALGVTLLAAFVLWERFQENRGRTPLVALELFSIKQFTVGALTMAMLSLGMVGLIFVLPVFLQSVRGLDAMATGLALLPLSLAVLIVGPLSGFLSHKIAPKRLIQAGLLITIVAAVWLSSTISVDATAATLAPALGLYGVGMGLVFAQISNFTLSAVSAQQAGEASGVNNTLRQVGSSLGSAILGAVLLSGITANVTDGIKTSTVIPDQLKPQMVAAASTGASNAAFGSGDEAKASAKLPPALQQEIKSISDRSVADSAHTTMLYAIPFTILALLMASLLPKRIESERSATPAAGH